MKKTRLLLLLASTCLALSLASTPARAADSLVSNGSFEQADDSGVWPAGWGRSAGVTWEQENGNHFLRLSIQKPGDYVQVYREFAIPGETKALALTWRQRVTGLVVGEQPWYGCRTLIKFLDANHNEVGSPSGTEIPWSNGTDGWENASASYLVPAGAHTFVYAPCLFHAKAGTFDIDNVVIKPASPEEIARLGDIAARALAAEKMRTVPAEASNPAKWPRELHIRGTELVDSTGKVVILQGVATGDLSFQTDDPQLMKSVLVAVDDWKANTIRLPVRDDFWFGQSPEQHDGGKHYRDLVNQAITLVANRGAYVILDLHRFRAPKPEDVVFWKDAATRYKNNPAVLFDLFNEPHDISWKVWRDGGWVGDPKKADESAFLSDAEKKANDGFESVGMQALIDAVRSTGADNIVIAGGLSWSGDLSGVAAGYALHDDPGGNGLMYAWHQYNWHTGWAQSVLPVIGKYPVLVGEFGADIKHMEFLPSSVHEESSYTWLPDMFGFIQKYHLNWTAWCFDPYATPRMLKDWTYEPTPYFGAFVKRALAGEKFEMKRMR